MSIRARKRCKPENFVVGWALLVLFTLTLSARNCLGFVAVGRSASIRNQTSGAKLVAPTGAVGPSKDDNEGDGDSSSSSSAAKPSGLFPVLKQIEGVNWEGTCRYANNELVPASFQLKGGIRFDLSSSSDTNGTLDTVEMNSFVVFPNGKSREIEMRGQRGSPDRPSMRLDSTGGPIYTVIAELEPDTILIKEVDKATGNTVMMSSLSLVTDYTADSTVLQLMLVSHEFAASSPTDGSNKNTTLEGHQVWRYRRKDAHQ